MNIAHVMIVATTTVANQKNNLYRPLLVQNFQIKKKLPVFTIKKIIFKMCDPGKYIFESLLVLHIWIFACATHFMHCWEPLCVEDIVTLLDIFMCTESEPLQTKPWIYV